MNVCVFVDVRKFLLLVYEYIGSVLNKMGLIDLY